MNFPDDRHYTKEHMWTKQLDDGTWQAGITDYAQDLLGDVVFIDPPSLDSNLSAGTACGLIESVKTGSDLHAPLNGEVTAINQDALDDPESVNDNPYENWLFTFTSTDTDTVLLSADDYTNLLDD